MTSKKERSFQAWDVVLNDEIIDTVFYTNRNDAQDVYRSLVVHDGYDPAIRVQKA